MRIFKVSIVAGILLFAGCSNSASEQKDDAVQTAEELAANLEQQQRWQASHESSQELACWVYHAANPSSDDEMITMLMESEPMMPLVVAESIVQILVTEC